MLSPYLDLAFLRPLQPQRERERDYSDVATWRRLMSEADREG